MEISHDATNGCHTDCPTVTKTYSNVIGGLEAFESANIHDANLDNSNMNDEMSNNVYMLIVDSKKGGPEFKNSGARITITDGLKTEEAIMNTATYEAERYWLAGCLRVEDGQYEFKQPPTEGIFFQFLPSTEVGNYCSKIFK